MWKIEKLDESGSRGRWVPASDARYVSPEGAAKGRRALVEEAMREAAQRGAWRTPRFRVVKAVQVVDFATVQ